MSSVEIHPSLISALQARARRERITVDDYEAVKAFRERPGRTTPLAGVKKRLGLDRPARRRG
jgi:hypothetical protein